MADVKEQSNFTTNQNELRSVFKAFERYHIEGRTGHLTNYDITIHKPDSVEQLYRIIRPHFEAIQKGTYAILKLHNADEANNPAAQASLKLLLDNEKPFLEQIDAIVRQYTSELRQKLTRLQAIELYIYLFTVAVLLSIGTFIFRPAVRKLRQTVARRTRPWPIKNYCRSTNR